MATALGAVALILVTVGLDKGQPAMWITGCVMVPIAIICGAVSFAGRRSGSCNIVVNEETHERA